MEILPNEIITKIFQYIPQRYIPILSIVCKQWHYIIQQPLLLNTIEIYSTYQLEKLIEKEKRKEIEKKRTKKENKELLLFGQHVQYIYLYTDRVIKKKLLLEIMKRFPNLHSIHGLKKDYHLNSISTTIMWRFPLHSLNHLNHFSYWYYDYGQHWMDLFIKNREKIKVLDIIKYSDRFSTVATTTTTAASMIYFKSIPTIEKRVIYTLQLPILPCLTYLSIQFLKHNGDEHILESIHQSCPQLISLYLYDFTLYISDDYKMKLQQQQSLIQPSLSLKEFNIHGTIPDSECCHYLSHKYPRLESLSLDLNSYSKGLVSNFKMAYYHLITQYSHLKRLKVFLLRPGCQKIEWPHTELLTWLDNNPTQFKHLELPYYLTTKNINDDYRFLQEVGQVPGYTYYNHLEEKMKEQEKVDEEEEKEENNTIETSSSSSSDILKNGTNLKYPHYLNHLSTLTLHCSIYFLMDSFYGALLHDKNDSIILSNTIENLNIERFRKGNIYIWLDLFPNLKTLSLKGYSSIRSHVLDNDIDDIKMQNENEKHDSYSLLMKKRRKQREGIASYHHHHSSSPSLTTNNIYKLKKIEMMDCRVKFDSHGWNGFFKRCPYLKVIILSNINQRLFSYHTEYISSPGQHSIFDLSHLSLDLLKINSVNYQPRIVHELYKQLVIEELKITETSLDKEYYVGVNNETRFHSNAIEITETLHIICKYIDCLVFDNHRVTSNHVYDDQGRYSLIQNHT